MSIDPGADELRIRELLVRRGIGPDAQPTATATEPADEQPPEELPAETPPTAGPPADPDGWWDEIFAGPDATAITTPAPPAGGGRLPAPGDMIDLAPAPEPDPVPPAWAAPPAPPVPPIPPRPSTPPTPANTPADDTDALDQDEQPPGGRWTVWKNRYAPDQPPAPTMQQISIETVEEVHAGLTQATQATVTDAAQRQRIAHVAHAGSAAALGWYLGIGPWIHGRLEHAGETDPSAGTELGLAVIALAALGEWATHGWRDRERHPITRIVGWLARIPLATAALALALYGGGSTA
ncbi:hypothetical protein ACMA1D_02010 [Streptomyces sp. 796.1]|uniref:hypothetical protein n=1 Tax=Streptomyces sp. 796.1 TaxID=3163029 RepID=UPI0039C9ECF7